MSERIPTVESLNVSKESVLDALRKMKLSGCGPYETEDPKAQEAQKLLDRWYAQLDKEAERAGTDEARLRVQIEKNTILIQAGYDDAEMLNSALDWLNQDLETAEELGKEGESVAREIRKIIEELENKLRQAEQK